MLEKVDESQLDRIVALAEHCPELYRLEAFKILLTNYLASLLAPPARERLKDSKEQQSGDLPSNWTAGIPAEPLTRLRNLAKRREVAPEKVAAVFDFSSDPFTFAPFKLPGKNPAEQTRNAALLVAARTFLSTGKWTSDWSETKAMCVDHTAYDVANFASTLKKEKGGLFKTVTVGTSVDLSQSGITDAETLLVKIADGSTNDKQKR